MMREVFFPTTIRQSYLLPHTIAAFSMTATTVRAVLVRVRSTTYTVEHYAEEVYAPNNHEALLDAIRALQSKLHTWDTLCIAIPSNRIVYKTLALPFNDPVKVRLVLPFEMEPILPFPVAETAVDAVSGLCSTENGHCDILAAAIKQEMLASYVAPFIELGMQPHKVTIGALEVASCLQEVAAAKQEQVIVLDTDEESLFISLVSSTGIKTPRVLAMPPELLENGIFSTEGAIEKLAIKQCLADIRFTIGSFAQQAGIGIEQITRVYLTGILAEKTAAAAFLTTHLRVACELAGIPALLRVEGQEHVDVHGMPERFSHALVTTLSRGSMVDFNIGRGYRFDYDVAQIKKTVLVAVTLASLLIVSILVYSTVTTSSLSSSVRSAQREAMDTLVTQCNLPMLKNKPLKNENLLYAENVIANEENLWSKLSTSRRYAFLWYLQELSSRVDREKLGLVLKRMIIKTDEKGDDIISMEGSVQDYDQVRNFEAALRDSKLFVTVPRLQETKFPMMNLLVDKKVRER
jgi:hypothetical protein